MENTMLKYDAEKYPNFKEYIWYKQHEVELKARYFGRYIVVKDEQVIGDYGSRSVARHETVKLHKPGTFIIHHCIEPDPRWAPRLIGHKLVTVHEK